MIEDLGRMIVETGCEQAIAWNQENKDIELSINISRNRPIGTACLILA
jgi:EAL domain-containing protein (putative c-di-GMP-specific phosphodiesterase class I)